MPTLIAIVAVVGLLPALLAPSLLLVPPYLVLAGALLSIVLLMLVGRRVLAGLGLAALLVALVLPRAAWAADGDTSVSLGPLVAALQPYANAIVDVLITALVAYAANLLRKKFGVDMDVQHRQILQGALEGGAGGVIQRLGSAAAAMSVDVKSPVVKEFTDRVIATVPKTINYFGLDPDDVAQKMLNRIPKLLPVEPPPVIVADPAAVNVTATGAAR